MLIIRCIILLIILCSFSQALEQRTVSVYDVLTVDEARRAITESQMSKKKVGSNLRSG